MNDKELLSIYVKLYGNEKGEKLYKKHLEVRDLVKKGIVKNGKEIDEYYANKHI